MDTKAFFEQAVSLVESASIRKWATSEHNQPIFLEIAGKAIENKKSPEDFTTFIILQAIG